MALKLTSLALLACAAYSGSVAFSVLGRGLTSSQAARPGLRGSLPGPASVESSGFLGSAVAGALAAGLGAAAMAARGRIRAAAPRAAGKTLVDRLTGTGPDSIAVLKDTLSFSTLVAAVKQAGLVDALLGPGPLTVFAPDDKAFSAFLASAGLTAEQLLANPDLAKILKHHVVAGTIMQKDFKNTSLTTLAGTTLAMKRGIKGVSVGGAIIVKHEVMADNGVVHVINGVLMP